MIDSEATDGRRTEAERRQPRSIDQIFEMDTNKDGLLAPSEARGRLAENFESIDTDGDGFISRTELENAPRPQRGQRGRRN